MQRYSSIPINIVLLFILCQITFANTAGIEQFIADVNPEEIKATIFDLQENVKLDQPDLAYKSRFALRVKNTSNPSDEAYDNIAEYIFRKFESYGMNVCGWHTTSDTADKLNMTFISRIVQLVVATVGELAYPKEVNVDENNRLATTWGWLKK